MTYEVKTRDELRSLCKGRGLKGYGKLNKDGLVEKLNLQDRGEQAEMQAMSAKLGHPHDETEEQTLVRQARNKAKARRRNLRKGNQ